MHLVHRALFVKLPVPLASACHHPYSILRRDCVLSLSQKGTLRCSFPVRWINFSHTRPESGSWPKPSTQASPDAKYADPRMVYRTRNRSLLMYTSAVVSMEP